MKKSIILGGAALIALSMTGCEKTGTVEGVVLDPFTKKPIEVPVVFLKDANGPTKFGTQSTKYTKNDAKMNALKDGKFAFEGVPVGEYTVRAQRAGSFSSNLKITTSNDKPNATVTTYLYKADVTPGMYYGSEEGPVKISAKAWLNYQLECGDESVTGYHQTIELPAESAVAAAKAAAKADDDKDAKKGKKDAKKPAAPAAAAKVGTLGDPMVVESNFDVFYINAGAELFASVYPAVEGKVEAHKDCKTFAANEKTAIFADKANELKLKVEYRAENLFQITGTLPKGKQILHFTREGKTVQTFYLDVK